MLLIFIVYIVLCTEPELPGCHMTEVLEYPDEMAAVTKSRFLTDIGKIIVGLHKKILRFVDAYPLDVGVAGHAIVIAELGSKIGVAHTKPCGEILHAQFLSIVAVYIFCHRGKKFVWGFQCAVFGNAKATFLPER